MSIATYVPVRFWRWYSFLLGTPSREAVAVYLWGRLHELSRYFAHGFETEPQGANKVHKQQQKRSHSPWLLSRASRVLGGALLMGVVGFLGGEGGPQKTGRNDWPPCAFYSGWVGSSNGCSAASSQQAHSFA